MKNLQWLLAGHKPNVFTKVRPTYKWAPNGSYGARTKSAKVAYSYRIGFPAKGQCGAKASKLVLTTGPYFLAILEGKKRRPVCWVALAAQRTKLAAQVGQPTPLALRIIHWELAQVGTHEQGWNRGYIKGPGGWSVDEIEGRFFGLHGLPWCEIFQEDGFKIGGYHPIPFSPYPFLVIDTYRWAASHTNYAQAKLQVGSLMVFLGDAGHIGLVYHIDADSAGHVRSYDTVEGNTSDGVYRRHYLFGDRLRVFIGYPGVTR